MIRRKRLTPKARGLREYYARCALGKPTARSEEKAERHAHEVAVIKATREKVFARDRRCRACDGRRRNFLDDQMDEVVPRSKTRGLPPEERFNTRNCIRYCALCHQDKTEHRMRAEFVDPVLGADGEVRHVWA